jgi:hypothetical protein
MLEARRESVGVQAEIRIVRELSKPVSFLKPDGQAEENPGPGRGKENGKT